MYTYYTEFMLISYNSGTFFYDNLMIIFHYFDPLFYDFNIPICTYLKYDITI